jgi:hypothetical protein
MKIISFDVIFVIKWRFGHWALLIQGYGYSEPVASEGRYLLYPAFFCSIFYSLLPITQESVPCNSIGFGTKYKYYVLRLAIVSPVIDALGRINPPIKVCRMAQHTSAFLLRKGLAPIDRYEQ